MTMVKEPLHDTEKARQLRAVGKTFATKRIEAVFANSRIKDNSSTFPQFNLEEITLGKVLGKGGFGTVYEIRGFETGKVAKHTASKLNDEETESAPGTVDFLSKHCIRHGGDSRFVLKILSPEVIANPSIFLLGAVDMAVETRILSDIDHPNIIRLRACAKVAPVEENYFFVVDRLFDSMEHRMARWAATDHRLTGLSGRIVDRHGCKKKEIEKQKLMIASDLCTAIGYLHSRQIVYRDLKPENVGFDIHDDVKVFDMGLAKELNDSYKPDKDGLYNLTGMTGSPRYMAPEVGNGQPYNMSCDVYSFSIIFWQMYSDQVPFEIYTVTCFKSRVWNGERKRPFVQESWPAPIKSLMRRAWSADIRERPNFDQMDTILKMSASVFEEAIPMVSSNDLEDTPTCILTEFDQIPGGPSTLMPN